MGYAGLRIQVYLYSRGPACPKGIDLSAKGIWQAFYISYFLFLIFYFSSRNSDNRFGALLSLTGFPTSTFQTLVDQNQLKVTSVSGPAKNVLNGHFFNIRSHCTCVQRPPSAVGTHCTCVQQPPRVVGAHCTCVQWSPRVVGAHCTCVQWPHAAAKTHCTCVQQPPRVVGAHCTCVQWPPAAAKTHCTR